MLLNAIIDHQVQEWKGRADTGVGMEGQQRLAPVQTDKPQATQSLLKIIRCNCRTECQTAGCACKKHGLRSSSASGECIGISCLNSSQPDVSETEMNHVE